MRKVKRRETLRRRKRFKNKAELNSLMKLMHETAKNRGEKAEERIERILSDIKVEGKIDGFLKTKSYSYYDRQGIDFLIFMGSKRIFLQVKSSPYGALKHQERGTEEGVIIPVIVVDPLKDDEVLKKEMLDIIYSETGKK